MEDIQCLYLTDLGPGIRVGLENLGRGGSLVTEIGRLPDRDAWSNCLWLTSIATRHQIDSGLAGRANAQYNYGMFTYIGQHVPRVSRIVSLINFTLEQSFTEYPDGQTPGE